MPGAIELPRGLDDLRRDAQREPVEITHEGRRDLVMMSARHYDWLCAAAQRSHRTAFAPDVVVSAVERAEMDPEHAALDSLLE